MIETNIIPFNVVHRYAYITGCPLCGKNDGYVNTGAKHWIICQEHKIKWLLGENLFEGWQNQTIFQYHDNLEILAEYTEVNPLSLTTRSTKH